MDAKTPLFWVGAVYTLAVPLIVGLSVNDAGTTGIVAACGIAVMVLTKIEDLVEISFGPLRARMRETIREAAATIEQLRRVATTISQVTLTDIMAGNFMGGTSLRTRFQLHDRIIQTLREVGVSEEQISEAESNWRRGIGVIYHGIIHMHLEGRVHPNRLNMDAPEELRRATQEFERLLDFSTWNAPSPEDMVAFIAARGIMNERVQQWIDDYRRFLADGEVPRLEAFLAERDRR